MIQSRGQRGFSLTETLIAIAILAIGMIFIAGVFPVGIHFTTISTERSIAAVVADEAFSKMRLCDLNLDMWRLGPGLPLRTNMSIPFQYVALPDLMTLPPRAFENFLAYPSQPLATGEQKQYYWSAICRVVDPDERNVQVTVFVNRRVGTLLTYWQRNPADPCAILPNAAIPSAVWVWGVPYAQAQSEGRELVIDVTELPSVPLENFVNDGDTIVDGMTGERYRVLERRPRLNPGSDPVIVVLDRAMSTVNRRKVWVVPPPVGGGRNPCIGVFQKEIRF
jgi:prepilin-type N-terminal cleavage/methylation domain-containing protein